MDLHKPDHVMPCRYTLHDMICPSTADEGPAKHIAVCNLLQMKDKTWCHHCLKGLVYQESADL